ncbi:hypothetical protein [Nostoc sp.]|uniref:hypothetical protein n=1 Tax=Nostoc sp. TaxID=1180 RepID=UPI002FF55714
MLIFKIELEQIEFEEKIDSYSRGHLTVQGRYGIISSKLSNINHSMMVFISLCDLLDGVRLFLINPIKNTYHFVGVGRENRSIGVTSSCASGTSQQKYIYDAFGSRVASKTSKIEKYENYL